MKQNQIDIVVLDDNIGDKDTLSFVKDIRRSGFEKSMIAASADTIMRLALVQNGCSHSIKNSKAEVPEIVHSILFN